MCGRFTFVSDQTTLTETFPKFNFSGYHHVPRYNIAPSQPIPVVANTGAFEVEYFHWGLIPHWAKDHKISSKMINARSETLAEKPSFRTAYRHQRCLILTDGFYEWKRNEDQCIFKQYHAHLLPLLGYGKVGLHREAIQFDPVLSSLQALTHSCRRFTTECQ